jgi:hypothetical protein
MIVIFISLLLVVVAAVAPLAEREPRPHAVARATLQREAGASILGYTHPAQILAKLSCGSC